jgi:hypothetical protein
VLGHTNITHTQSFQNETKQIKNITAQNMKEKLEGKRIRREVVVACLNASHGVFIKELGITTEVLSKDNKLHG